MSNKKVRFEFGESRSLSSRLLHFLEVNNYHILPNYTFKMSFDEEILERESIEEVKELEDYAYYCLTNLEEVIKVNTPIMMSIIERADEIERIYSNNLQEDEDVTEIELVNLIIEMKNMLKEKDTIDNSENNKESELEKYKNLKNILNETVTNLMDEYDLDEVIDDYTVKIDIKGQSRTFGINADLSDRLEKFLDDMIEIEEDLERDVNKKEDEITYEHTFSEEFDMTIIVKTTETDKEIVTEISGFYFGLPSEDEIELFKDRGTVSVVEK